MDLPAAIDRGLDALDKGSEREAIAEIEPLLGQQPDNAKGWQVLGLLYRNLERSEQALDALKRAAELAPRDGLIANALAQTRLEAGLDATEAFAGALSLSFIAQAVQGYAAALNAAGRRDEAIDLLDRTLTGQPAWGEGHWLFGRLNWMAGNRDGYLSALDRALAAQPGDAGLWQMRFSIQLRSLDFSGVVAAVPRAIAALGETRFVRAAEAAALSELGEIGQADALFQRIGPSLDITDTIYRLRHLLRSGRPQAVSESGFPIAAQSGPHVWPYLSLAWRQLGDPRWEWLEGQEGLIRKIDIREHFSEFDAVVARLRTIHAKSAEPLEQSVRGGTQTDGPLFARIEPEIQALRAAVVKAVEQHVAALPPIDPQHPQLSLRRDRSIRFAGAWSIRLHNQGHHVSHIHPEGWFSSALYLALPDSMGREGTGDRSGWLALGEPDPSLGIDLPAFRTIEPREGSLVLFPSTLWHGTIPFSQGERMTVAFDVAPPPA